MTEMLEEAFQEASELSPTAQDALASILIGELESEQRWVRAFAENRDALSELGDAAMKEDAEGRTETLDPSAL